MRILLCLSLALAISAQGADLGAQISHGDLLRQAALYPSTLPGREALKIALEVIMHDEATLRNPLSIVGSREALVEALNRSETKLYLVGEGNEDLRPQWGEKVSQNWIFCLYMPHVSDHLYWVVVDRRGV